jgi:F-type H+-transporting ATPase subunit epsilon
MASYRIKVLTPQGLAYQGEAVHSLVPAEDGFVGVLANHAPYVTASPGGRFEVKEAAGGEKKFQAGPGFFEVAFNEATFLTQSFSAVDSSASSRV